VFFFVCIVYHQKPEMGGVFKLHIMLGWCAIFNSMGSSIRSANSVYPEQGA